MLPKFIEDCNRLLPDGAADSARFMGLCAHSTCRSTMSARNCLQRIHLTLQIWTPMQMSLCGGMHKAFLKASSEAKYTCCCRTTDMEQSAGKSAQLTTMLALGDSWKDICLTEAAAPSDSLFLGAVYKYTYSLTHSHCFWIKIRTGENVGKFSAEHSCTEF